MSKETETEIERKGERKGKKYAVHSNLHKNDHLFYDKHIKPLANIETIYLELILLSA